MDIFYPFEALANWLSFTVFSLEETSHLGMSVEFFLYDTLKIFALMIIITHLMSILRYYLPIEKLRDFLTSRNFYGTDYFLASLFGAVTPFCSCSSLPLFIGFLSARIPLGVTFAFLITSPLINEVALALFLGIFGWKITLLYLVAGMSIGMIGGFLLGKMKLEKFVEDFVWKMEKPKTLRRHKENILNYYLSKSTNAFTEGVHTRFELLEKDHCGVRNIERFAKRLLFSFIPFSYIAQGFC